MFSWNKDAAIYEFCFVRLPFPGPSAFVGFFFSLVPIYMFKLLAFSVLYLAYVRQIVNSRSSLLCSSGPDHSAFLPTFHSVLCFFTEALVVFGGKNREKYVYFISSEVASLTHFSSLVLRAQHHVLIAELCCTF